VHCSDAIPRAGSLVFPPWEARLSLGPAPYCGAFCLGGAAAPKFRQAAVAFPPRCRSGLSPEREGVA
jgi:hypothetical protein